jgi:UDPglucose--hexose-1-phosphate uridylyltransferase
MTDSIRFHVEKKIARLHDPRRNFELSEIESEVRYDPLTRDTARICHFALPQRELPDLSALIESTRGSCPFCPPVLERVTPRYPDALLSGGRMRRGEAVLVPNIFPYDDVSAILIVSRAHHVPLDRVPGALLADALKLARDFIALAAPGLGGRDAYGIVTWNYMPPAGASQVHPHMQVIVTDTPGNALRRELEAEALFAQHHGRPYMEALLESERSGPRWLAEERGVAWWVPFCPAGLLGDAQAVIKGRSVLTECSDAELDAFAQSLARVLAAYARLGHWSFNLTLFPDAQGQGPHRHWLTARLLPRLYLNPKLHNSDVAYLQLLLAEKFAMLHPERHAAELRALLTQAPPGRERAE